MAKKVILKDQDNVEILPITRGELIVDSSGKEAFHSNEFLATNSQPGLMSPEEKVKISTIAGNTIDSTLSTTSVNPVQNKVVTGAINEAKQLANDAQEIANDASENVSKVQQIINSIKESYLKSATVDGNVLTIVDQSDSEITFTNTIYNTFLKETAANTGGRNGLVPKPNYNDGSKTRFLREDGTWVIPTNSNTTYTFANGTSGNFTVTPSGGTAQTVSIGKPATAGTADVSVKLQTKRKLWGQDFDGSADVSGDMAGVGIINTIFNLKTQAGNASLYLETTIATTDYAHIFVSNKNDNKTHASRPLVLQNGYGNVGIGTTSPEYKLDVNGVIRASSHLITNARVKILDGQVLEWNDTAANGSTSNLLLPRKSYGYRLDYYDGTAWHKLAYADDIPTVTNYYWANVPVSSTSITTTTPTFGGVTVNGGMNAIAIKHTHTLSTAWNDFIRCLSPNLTTTYHTAHIIFGRTYDAKNVGYIGFKYAGAASNSNMVTIGLHSVDNVLNVLASGNVGIGTTSPSYKLHAAGDIYATGWSRAGSGFYVEGKGVHYMSNNVNGLGQIYLTSNEFNWSASTSSLYFNYRASANGTTVTHYNWHAGSSGSYATHRLGSIHIHSNGSSYNESIRIHPSSAGWHAIVLCGTDNTGDSGVSTNTWGIYGNSGTIYINKGSSSSASSARAMGTSTGWTFGNTSTNSYALNTASFICDSWVRTSGATGWYSQSYGGGIYMEDSTWVRTYNGKSFYCSAVIQAGGRIYTGYDSGQTNSISCSNWFRSNGSTGWYNPTNECHVYPNNISTYGGLILRGIKSSYHGFLLGTSTSYMNVMSTDTHHGLYCENTGQWEFYYNRANRQAGILTSSLTSGHALTVGGNISVVYNSYPGLTVHNNTTSGESSIYVKNNTAGWAIGVNTWGIGAGQFAIGQYSGTESSSWRFRIDNNGYCYTNSYLNLGGGHEKNASSPTYVWGSNSSDTYLRSYQTSKLSVSYAASAGSVAWANVTGKPTIPTLYDRNLGINGTNWTFSSQYNSATTSIYAPTSAGTSGYILQSSGGTPTWTARQDYSNPGILWVGYIYRSSRSSTSYYASKSGGKATFSLTSTPNSSYEYLSGTLSGHTSIMAAFVQTQAVFSDASTTCYAYSSINFGKGQEAGFDTYRVSISGSTVYIRACRMTDANNSSWEDDGFLCTGSGHDDDARPVARLYLMIIGY